MDGSGQARERAAERGAKPTRARSPFVRGLLVVAGFLFVALAAAGAVLPLVPATPFLLLAAACWVRASERLYQRLLANRLLGPYLHAWREEHRVPRRAKVTAIALVVATFASTIVFAVDETWARALLALLGVGLVVFLTRLPSDARGTTVEPEDLRVAASPHGAARASRSDHGRSRGRYGLEEETPLQSSGSEIDE